MYLIICCLTQITPSPIATLTHIAALSCILANSTFYALPPPICNASILRILSKIFAGNKRDFLLRRKCKGNSFQNLTNTKAYFGETKRGEGKQFCLLFEEGIHLDKIRERCTSLPLLAKWQLQGALKFLVNNFHNKYFLSPSLNSDIFPDCLFFVSCHFPQIKLIRDPHSTHYLKRARETSKRTDLNMNKN